jgi:hypothetical protein
MALQLLRSSTESREDPPKRRKTPTPGARPQQRPVNTDVRYDAQSGLSDTGVEKCVGSSADPFV